MGIDAGPAIRAGLAFVIETGPHMAARDEGANSDRLPGIFSGCVVRADIAGGRIAGINATIGRHGSRLAAEQRLRWKRRMKRIVAAGIVIAALQVLDEADASAPTAVHSAGDGPRGVELQRAYLHRLENIRAVLRALDRSEERRVG